MLRILLFLLVAALAYPQVIGIVRFTSNGTDIINAGDAGNNSVRVSVVSGAAGVTHVDDAGFTVTTDDGVPAFAMFDDTSPDSVNEGDAGVLRMSANRNLYGTIRDAAGNERGVNVNASNQLSVSVDNNVTIGTFPDNEPFNIAQYGGVATGAGNAFYVRPGTSAVFTTGHDATGIAHGLKTVTSAGTDEAIAGSTAAKYVDVQAQTDNTGWIAVGGTGVDATVATGNGILLAPGDHTGWIKIDNLADIFVDSTVSGDGVRFTYLN